jgi:L-ornithine Nalpha-acyltransferase
VLQSFASRADADGRAPGLFDRFAKKRDLAGLAPSLARSGSLEARLALTGKDVRRAQKLRYRVFFEEGASVADAAARLIRRDVCRFDSVCDHLIVVDHALPGRRGAPKVVGVYRLLRQDVAERNFGFYSAGEFDVASLIARRPDLRFLELGRACVAASHRGRHVLDLLWRGLWAYARHHKADVLIGCASLAGADPGPHAAAIRALGKGGDAALWVAPRLEPTVPNGMAPSAPADPRALSRALPPLVKGYWRLGATFSPEPVADPAFGATDLFVALPLSQIESRYLQHFRVEAPERPKAA